MHIEGYLQIDLYPVAEQVNRVSLQSSRPLQAARIFEGKSPQEVLMQLPLLYGICGTAQAAAAVQAFQQALALTPGVPVTAARALLVQMETAREHLFRILVDWPGLLDELADATQAAPLQPMLRALHMALFGDGDAFDLEADIRVNDSALQEQIDHLDEMLASLVFGCPPAQWLQINNREELDDWVHRTESIAARLLRHVSKGGWQGLGAADGGFLPELPEAGLNWRLEASDAGRFIAEPMWDDCVCETTALARQRDAGLVERLHSEYGNGLITRLTARLVELAKIPAIMRSLAERLGASSSEPVSSLLPDGIGIGQVEAARGRLVHRVVMNGDKVRRYQILAPTEWNFHPEGVVARGLGVLPDTDEATLRRQAAMLINAVDPCVGYDLLVH